MLTTSVVVVVNGAGGMPVVVCLSVQGQSVIVRVSDWGIVSGLLQNWIEWGE